MATAFLLAAILGGSVMLWWPLADIYIIASDDATLILGSQSLAAGNWHRLLEPQGPHILPLYKLLRLYFDLHFPARFHWMYGVAILAHLSSAILLFVLSKHYLRTAEAPLVVALFFAWQTWGWEAMVISSQNTYVLSLPFLLGAVCCVIRLHSGRLWTWAAGCFLYLVAAVGLHSLAAASAIPGVLAGYYLLGRPRERRGGCDVAAWLACCIPLMLAIGLWMRWGLPRFHADLGAQGFPRTAFQTLAQLWHGLQGTMFLFGFLVSRHTPTFLVLVMTALGWLALLLLLRPSRSRFLITALALTTIPAFVTFVIRTAGAFYVSRYGYQSFLAIAVAAGCAVDFVLESLRGNRFLRVCALVALIFAVPFYWTRKEWIEHKAVFLEGPSAHREYWMGWDGFFNQAAADARASSSSFRLPMLRISQDRTISQVFQLCNPKGKPEIVVLSSRDTHEADCTNFWRKVQVAKKTAGAFNSVPLPDSMAIVTFHQEVPAGKHLICRVPAKVGPPTVLSGAD
ncbi:MAG: hypothetical protein HY236_02145 [Acidobacteria bacterium]|nr:hypothetical protein [Acidobacteriota bacterium]